jgi:CDP-diacylglycerol--glycerol-3-phosphate 3-phosphatidyltransferase
MTPPNAITLARMLVVPVVVWLILADFANHERWAAVAYGIAASTDSLDGYLARRRPGWTSVGGVFLDPLADKLLVMGALIALVEEAKVSTWVVLIIVAREFAVTGLRLVAAGGSSVISASQLGKLKTFSQNVMVVCLLLAERDAGWTHVVVAIALALTIWSFADYFWRGRHHFVAREAPPP